MNSDTLIIVTARDEADRIGETLAALAHAFPHASVWVADDGSSDGTADVAERCGASVVRSARRLGKGGAATLAARQALAWLASSAAAELAEACAPSLRGAARSGPSGTVGPSPVMLLCDGDLGPSAELLAPLVEAVRASDCDLAVATFARRVGGGFGLALGFAGWAIRRRCGLRMRAPISGQRALGVAALERMLPFADGFGMEIGMTIDAARAGLRVVEIELDLSHRATGRTPAGFLHRARQLLDFARVYRDRRGKAMPASGESPATSGENALAPGREARP